MSTSPIGGEHRATLTRIARRAMLQRGLLPDFSAAALAELGALPPAIAEQDAALRDLRHLPWCSIDNDESRDLDQLSVAQVLAGGQVQLRVALADVATSVARGSALDAHARHNTTSVYTPAVVFSMLPERLSTDLTSLNYGADRRALVVEMQIAADGSVGDAAVYAALVRNGARLSYNGVAAWLDGGSLPAAVAAVPGLEENLRLQDAVGQRMKQLRQEHGALNFESRAARAVFAGDQVSALQVDRPNRAQALIADFMIAANGVTARYLAAQNFPALRRVVRVPKRWERIVTLAAEHGERLPADPDPRALNAFLLRRKAADPLRFADLSLSIIKLLGPGQYVAQPPGDHASPGHFGLAVGDYTHSTAPNRRYPDLVTQRLLMAAQAGQTPPYAVEELESLATHCTAMEDAAKKVERQVGKSAAAMLLQSRIGQQFDAIVTGAADKGTWVRLVQPPVEGKLIRGYAGVDVGDKIRVQLLHTDVEQGFIDFTKVD